MLKGASFGGRWTQYAIVAIVVLGGWTDATAAPPQRLAWTQQSADTGLSYNIFIDDQAAIPREVTCVAVLDATECSTSLPDMAAGIHVIVVSAVDAAGYESPRSEPLTITVVGPGLALASRAPLASAARGGRVADAIPLRACAGQACYRVSLLARGEGTITRLDALSDGGVLLLRDRTDVLLLRSGVVVPAYQLRRDDPASSAIADIAVDPDFARNHFVYLSVVTTTAQTSAVRVVRTREAGDRLAEAATIVPDLPIGQHVMPRLAVSVDGHIYLAVPPSTDDASPQPYDGAILAFTNDGRSAGVASASPVLARGLEPSAALEAGAAAEMWIGSSADDGMRLLRLSADGTMASARAAAAADAGVRDLAFARPDRGFLIAASGVAYAFQLSSGTDFAADRMQLGGFEATALTIQSGGDLVVAARSAANPQSVTLLSLHADNGAR